MNVVSQALIERRKLPKGIIRSAREGRKEGESVACMLEHVPSRDWVVAASKWFGSGHVLKEPQAYEIQAIR